MQLEDIVFQLEKKPVSSELLRILQILFNSVWPSNKDHCMVL